jgi:RimJ/RimL family protein N-acetyltransferase
MAPVGFAFQPILENDLVLLRPLEQADRSALYALASDPLVWEQHPAKERSTPEGFEPYFAEAIACGKAFAILDKTNHQLMGTSRYHPVPEYEDAIEIGWTFLARKYWGAGYNRQVKDLMIRHAFHFVSHVLFHVDAQNYRSQKAVEKIGGRRLFEINDIMISPRGPREFIFGIHRDQGSPQYP